MNSSASPQNARTALAPEGVLKVGINTANTLLVTPNTAPEVWEGIVPDLARALAAALGVPCRFVSYPKPAQVADATASGECGIAFLASDPERERTLAFSPAYLEIVATYLVPQGSALRRVEEVDGANVRIAVVRNSGYHLSLKRQLQHASLVEASSPEEAFCIFRDQRLEAMAGLEPLLLSDQARMPGSVLLPSGFTRIQQAIATARGNAQGAAYLATFVQSVKMSGGVQRAIDTHGIAGVRVAAP